MSVQIRDSKRRPSVSMKDRSGLLICGLLVLLTGIIGTLVFVSNQSGPKSNNPVVKPVDAATLWKLTHVNSMLLARTGTGGLLDPLQRTKGSQALLTGAGGKPEVFYYSAQYCPNCAAEPWSLIVALSRFGTFHNLKGIISSSTDDYPNTSTFTFYGGSYFSPYLDFVPVEILDREGAVLQEPTTDQQNLLSSFDAPPYVADQDAWRYPFLDIGNRYLLQGAIFDPGLLRVNPNDSLSVPLTQKEIVDQLASGNQLAYCILGTANYITAAICTATRNRPGSVCNDPSIQKIEATLSLPDQPGSLTAAPVALPAAITGELAAWRKGDLF